MSVLTKKTGLMYKTSETTATFFCFFTTFCYFSSELSLFYNIKTANPMKSVILPITSAEQYLLKHDNKINQVVVFLVHIINYLYNQ